MKLLASNLYLNFFFIGIHDRCRVASQREIRILRVPLQAGSLLKEEVFIDSKMAEHLYKIPRTPSPFRSYDDNTLGNLSRISHRKLSYFCWSYVFPSSIGNNALKMNIYRGF